MWLLTSDVYEEIMAAKRAGLTVDAETRASLALSNRDNGTVQLTGATAVIPINGVLTTTRDWIAALFGGGNTTYEDINNSLVAANADPRVKDIRLDVGRSPGGNVSGLFRTMDAIRGSEKPVTAYVRDMAASAAYGLVSQAGELRVAHKSTELGSVGVAVDTYLDGQEVSVTSTEAPKKRPDLSTDEGRATVREELDALHKIFAETIAAGRKTTVDDVNKNYGRGAVVLAEAALVAGMIDGIGTVQQTAATRGVTGGSTVDRATLLATYPELYAAIKNEGVVEERDRVTAHLRLGETCGAMDTAVKAIRDGELLTMALQAEYISASANKRDLSAREADNPDVGTVPVETTTADVFGRQVLAHMGIEVSDE